MPFLPSTFTPDYSAPNRLAAGNASLGDINAAANAISRQDHGLVSTVLGDAALGVVDLADTVRSSIPILSKAMGFERGGLNASFLRAIDSPGLNDFYNDNKGGIEVASGIYGIVASELIARKVTAPGGAIIGALKTLPYARRIATLDMQAERALRTVRVVDQQLAKRGALGAEQFVGRVMLGGTEVGRRSAVWGAKGLAAAKGVRNAAVTEAIMATTLNQNGFLYDDSYSHNLMWMGAGLGIAGAFESIATGYAIRKAVNSDETRRLFANALDPDASEKARVGWHGKSVDPKKFRGLADIPEGQGFLGGTITDNVTNLLVGAKSKTGTAVDDVSQGAQTLFANRSRLATQEMQLAREEIQKVTMKGIEGNGFTRFGNQTANSSGVMNHLDQVMKRDPGSMYGLEEIGAAQNFSDNAVLDAIATHQGRENRIKTIIAGIQDEIDDGLKNMDPNVNYEELEGMLRRYKWKESFIPVPIIDGERATISDLQGLAGWVEPTIARSNLPDNVPLWEAKTESSGTRVGLDGNGQIYLPDNESLNDADHFDVMRLYRLGQKMIDEAAKGSSMTLNLPKDANYFQLDLAEEIARVNPRAQINYPEGMTRESAAVESFAQKAEYLRQESKRIVNRKALARKAKGGPKEYDPTTEASRLRVRLNLPKMTAYERGVLGESEHPVEQLLRGASKHDGKAIRKLTLAELKKGAADIKRIGDFAPAVPSDFETLTGNSFRYMLDEFGQPTKPILAYSRPLDKFEWGTDHLAERMATARLNVAGKMGEGDNLTANVTRAIMDSSDLAAASETRELMETAVQGSVTGTNHLTALGAAAKSVKARDFVARDTPNLLAAQRIQNAVSKMTSDMFAREAEALNTIASQLDSPRNAASKLLIDTFVAHRPGWDLAVKKKVVQTTQGALPNGTKVTKFVLADTEKNQRRWQEVFGEAMPEDAVLTAPNGREVTLDDMGIGFMTEFNRMTDSVRANKNQLLRAQGLRQIDELPYYIPPKNIDGKFIGFTMDVEGNVVPGMTVIADTETEFARQQARIMKEIEDKGLMGYRFRTRDDIKQFADIWDRAQMDMIDPGTTAIQGGKQNRGLLQGSDIDLKGTEGILNTLRSQYLNHGQDVLRSLFKDQLQSAEARSNIASTLTRNNANPQADQKYRNIHDMYIENLTGKSPLRSKGSFIGGFYNWTEGKADQILAQMQPGFSRVWAATNSFIGRAAFWDKSEGAKRDFESLTKHLGEYMPFENAAQYAERLGAGTMPVQLKDLMGTTSRFTAAIMLRVFEPIMAVMNLSGMVNSMPAVIRHVQQQAGESVEAHAARVGHIATIFEGAGRNGESIGVLNMGKLMTRGFQRAWNKASHADYDYMRRNGYLTQEVAEFQKQFGSIETKKDWERVMFGDKNAKQLRANPGNLADRATTEKGIVGWMSVLTDKSEDFSRSWGHMVGLELADQLGIRKMEARHAFAHDIANKMIANYNPNNRPEVFQGALGAPLGLFQSFVMNYYQRMFRYLETRDLRSAAVQTAMQASLFGVPTIPGFGVAAGLFFNATDGEEDPVAAIQNRFGATTGDLLFGGALSNIPKLFGQEGIDLYSRGDVSIRLPGAQLPPAFTLGEKMLTGTRDMLRLFVGDNPRLSTTQVAEVLSNAVPNRPIAGMIEQMFAQGYDTDSAGQVVSDTKSMMESVYRMLGVRSMRQSKELEAFYANRNKQTLQANQLEMLRLATRTAFREGDMDAIPGILEKYVEQGGNPRNARRWLKEQYEAATETRGVRALEGALKSPEKMDYAVRLLDAGVSIDDDEETEDYADSLAVDSSEFGQVNHEMMDYPTDSVQSSIDQP